MKKYYIDGRQLDVGSLTLADVNPKDYPDFSDAFIEEGYFEDGGQLSDQELEQVQDEYPELVNELAFEHYT